MKRLIHSKIFTIAFFGSYIAFVITTMYLYDFVKPGIGIGHTLHGFPFSYYYAGCYGGDYLWIGFIENLVVAALFSFVVGLVISHIWQKLSSPEFRSKWYL